MCSHVQITTSRGRYCQRCDFHHLFRSHFVQGGFFIGISETLKKSMIWVGLYKCFLSATLNWDASVGCSEKDSAIYQA